MSANAFYVKWGKRVILGVVTVRAFEFREPIYIYDYHIPGATGIELTLEWGRRFKFKHDTFPMIIRWGNYQVKCSKAALVAMTYESFTKNQYLTFAVEYE